MPCFALAIEISNPAAADASDPASLPGVAASRVDTDGALSGPIDREPLRSEGYRDNDLLPAISRLTARMCAAPHDLAWIGVSTGPGGFTGIRVGIATAQSIAQSLDIPVRAVPSGAVAAATARTRAGWDRVAVLLATKRETAWVEVFELCDGPLAPVRVGLVSPRELSELEVDAVLSDPALREGRFADAWADACAGRWQPLRLDPASCLAEASRRPALRPGGVRPLYAREPEAVTKWRELHGR
ncbi:MAG: tRNA (adenosine(37)-N6)-threonylcarbamoyltransferase complex dimerization subunit type 1 TsaB [Planctomycetota bacterium]